MSSRLPAPTVGTETQGDGRKVNTPGIYILEAANKVVETSPSVPGHVQADALVQLGFRKMSNTEVAEYTKSKEAKTTSKETKNEAK